MTITLKSVRYICECGSDEWSLEPAAIFYRPISDPRPAATYRWYCTHCSKPLVQPADESAAP